MSTNWDSRSSLVLFADGTCWTVAAEDEEARQVVDRLVGAMDLPVGVGTSGCEIRVRTVKRLEGEFKEGIDPYAVLAEGDDASGRYAGGKVLLRLEEPRGWEGKVRGLLRLASVIALGAIRNGGVMLHGALAEWRGMGVVLAGPSGARKWSACRRLPSTWEVRSDDTTLLVTDPEGSVWAHPWPSWGASFWGGPGGSCEVRRPTPLKAICFLSQGPSTAVKAVGEWEAADLGQEMVDRAMPMVTLELSEERKRSIRLSEFQSLCAMLRKVPAYDLSINLLGQFWDALQVVLMGDARVALNVPA